MCHPTDYQHLMTPEPTPPAPARSPILEAADALGLPDCPAGCTCRGAAPATTSPVERALRAFPLEADALAFVRRLGFAR